MKPIKLLWMSDSPTVFTGFSTVTKEIVGRLAKTGHYEIACIGWGYNGWPYNREEFPYDIYPSNATTFGQDVFIGAVEEFQPNIVLSLGDLWMLEWMSQIQPQDQYKSLIYFPIDGHPIPLTWLRILTHIDLPIVYSHYAQEIVEQTFPNVKTKMIYHGVDLDVFRPLDKAKIKQKYNMDGKFIVGCVARNQPRKQLPILIKAFAKFSRDKKDAFLYLHTDPNDIGWDIIALLQRYNLILNSRISNTAAIHGGVSKKELNEIYNLFDVKVLPSSGEGFGLPLVEAMAAGVPIVTTNYSANAEMAKDRGELIAVKMFMTDWRQNAEVALADEDDLVAKLNLLYENPELRQSHIKKGLAFTSKLSWDPIVQIWDDLLIKIHQGET